MKKLITSIVLPIMLLLLTTTLCSCGKGSRIFDCEQYDLIMYVGVNATESRSDVLVNQTYRLIFHDDGTFVMQVKQKNASDVTEYKGNYSEKDNIITLSYVDDYPDEKLSTPAYTLSDDGKTLSRKQNVYTDNNTLQLLYTIEQTFVK